MNCCDYGCTRAKNCPAGSVTRGRSEYDANQALGRMDIDTPINTSIQHEPMEGGGDIVIPWQAAIALLIFCIGLAGYAYQIFNR